MIRRLKPALRDFFQVNYLACSEQVGHEVSQARRSESLTFDISGAP